MPESSEADGLKVAVAPLKETVPGTVELPFFSVNVAVFTDNESIASLKLAVTEAFSTTPVAPAAGETEPTVGGVLSTAAAVVKVHEEFDAMVFPARSLTPVVIVAV